MRRNRLIFGAAVLLLGVLLLVENLGFLDFLGVSIWQLLWPVAMVALGVWLLVGATRPRPQYQTQDLTVPLEAAEAATVRFDFGAGELRIEGGAPQEAVLTGTFESGVEHEIQRQGQVDVRLQSPKHTWWWPWDFRPGDRRRWHVRPNETLPLNLVVRTGASDCRLALEDWNVKELRIESGAASVSATLPARACLTRVRGSGGAASLSLRIPAGVAARIAAQGGLSSVSVDRGRFPRQGSVYVSPNYDTAANKVDIKLDVGVGSISIH